VSCIRCGTRQDDPPRGPSAWKRGVLGGEQVLVCPDCQRQSGWQAGLDRCPECDGVRLSKALGIVRCSACGWSGELPVAATPAMPEDEGLAGEVQAALDRVLRARDQ
jgi:ribosomal protein L37AE/L43A